MIRGKDKFGETEIDSTSLSLDSAEPDLIQQDEIDFHSLLILHRTLINVK